MASFDELRNLVRAIADARDIPGSIGLRTPGETLEVSGQDIDTGKAWGDDKSLQILLEGIGQWLDASGVSGVSTIYAKLNELISAYNQLRADYIDGGGTTTAPVVSQMT